jgi:arabinose-5-phosphate isomerase
MNTKTIQQCESVEPIVEELIQQLRSSMDVLFQKLDTDRLSDIVRQVASSEGVVFCTGVGKSGVIAQKVAMTLSCSGTKAFFLSPQGALHGDIGAVCGGDVVFIFSKSGETAELLELCPALRNKGARLVAVVMNPKGRLAHACDTVFVLPELKELCPFDLSPTTSTVAQLIFGDLLAMTLMRRKGVSLPDLIENHPNGRIGRRQLLKVKDLMLTGSRLPVCGPADQLGDILVELSNKQCGCICVVDESSRLLGVFTDGDLRRTLLRLGPAGLGASMESLMTKNPRTIGPDALAYDAMHAMEADPKHLIMVLVVVEDAKCVGVLKMHDILQAGIA